jgi:hypothetical protein
VHKNPRKEAGCWGCRDVRKGCPEHLWRRTGGGGGVEVSRIKTVEGGGVPRNPLLGEGVEKYTIEWRRGVVKVRVGESTDKKEIKFSCYIRKFRMKQVQSHI